ncbi:MAG: hypothetical protein H6606_07745 [Flavobacteriales bacterium]|nr:hypothetical protein [Flavobacteriales bacterium]
MKRTRICILLFQIGLLLSGITAFWIPEGVASVDQIIQSISPDVHLEVLKTWLTQVDHQVQQIDAHASFIWYGTDWLAFAHILFAILFIGPLVDPIRNRWVMDFGLVACILIIPTALLAGAARAIPLVWRLLDCSFGIIGAILLLISNYRKIESHLI